MHILNCNQCEAQTIRAQPVQAGTVVMLTSLTHRPTSSSSWNSGQDDISNHSPISSCSQTELLAYKYCEGLGAGGEAVERCLLVDVRVSLLIHKRTKVCGKSILFKN